MDAHLGERLSAYLDGELEGEERAEVEVHLRGCAECRRALDDLRRVVRRAATLDDQPPSSEREIWAAIAARLGAHAPGTPIIPLAGRRRFTFSMPQLAAAAVILTAVSAGGAVLLTRALRPAPQAALIADAYPVVPPGGYASARAVASYDAAIRDLESTLAARRPQLDTATVRAVEQSLAVIDRAIRQAEAALKQDPNSLYLNSHLEDALGRKLDVLRRVTSLIAAS